MVLGCYLDDSRGGRRIAVAGYLARQDVWDAVFVPHWKCFLASAPHEISEYKASDCRYPGHNEFAGWSKDEIKDYGIKAVRELADAEAVPDLFGIGAGAVLGKTSSTRDARDWEVAIYEACFQQIVLNVAHLVRIAGSRHVRTVQFVHDEGDKDLKGKLVAAFDRAKDMVQPDLPFVIHGLDFRPSVDLPALQAADIIAYETRKDIENRLAKPQRPRSRGLIHLLRSRPHAAFYVDHQVIESVQTEEPMLPPIIYASDDIDQYMPWVNVPRPEMVLPPLMPPDDSTDGNTILDSPGRGRI